MINNHLPFGGVGSSGYGRFHGKAGFLSFSNMKSVVETRPYNPYPLSCRYPPYTEHKKTVIKTMLKYGTVTYGTLCKIFVVILVLIILGLIIGLVIVP